jgi:hypothetical protein
MIGKRHWEPEKKEIAIISKKLNRTKGLKGKEGVNKIYMAINETTKDSAESLNTSIVKTPTAILSPEKSVYGDYLI